MQTIKLDLQRQSILTPLKAKQNDRYSRFFKAVLLDGSTAFSIPSGAALTVRYIAPSGSGWYDTITEINGTTKHSAFSISGNEATVELAEAMLTKPGNGTLCLHVYAASGYRIGTWNIPLEIEADLLTDSTIAASDYYNVLTAQVAQALGYRDAAANSADSATQSATALKNVYTKTQADERYNPQYITAAGALNASYANTFPATACIKKYPATKKVDIHIDFSIEVLNTTSPTDFHSLNFELIKTAIGARTLVWNAAVQSSVTMEGVGYSYAIWGRTGLKCSDTTIGRCYDTDLYKFGGYPSDTVDIFKVGNTFHVDILGADYT